MKTVPHLRIALLALGLLALSACNRKSDSDPHHGHDHSSHAHPSPAPGKTAAPGAGGLQTEAGEKCPHDALKKDCFICNPKLRDRGRLWCKEHGRYEDRCFLCHPEVKEEGRAYCEKHFLYEDECFLCRPELKKTSAVEAEAIKAPDLMCKEHGVLESECGICHPDLLAGLKTGDGLKVRLASTESAKKGGVESGKPEADEAEGGPVFLCRVTYNENRFAHILSRASGTVRKVHVDFGTRVKKGEQLVEIASPDIARLKSAYLSALSDLHLKELAHGREKGLAEKNVSSRQEFELAEAEYRRAKNEASAARQELLDFGMSEADLSTLVKSGASSSTLSLRAPFAGTVIERNAVTGEAVNSETPLFAIGDLSTLWLELSLPPESGASLKVGDPVAAGFDALPGVQFPGRLIWVAPAIDETTRMLKARALIANPEGLLKNGMFGKVRIPSARGGKRLGLPSEAVQRIEGENFVFVKLKEDLYEARKVWAEEGLDGKVIVLDGLAPGENVVYTGTYAMKTELLKSRLGAGCADGH